MREIVILVGVPGSGKSWVTERVGGLFQMCLNDDHIGKNYGAALLAASKDVGPKPILGECPFSVSQIVDPLRAAGRKVTTVYIIEDDRLLTSRYFKRERKPIPAGHLTRQRTYAQRAKEQNAFAGTSDEVASHLKTTWGKS